jgi:hypothetical protein
MNWSELDTWIVITGVLICLACALPGAFLMLNRQSMLGDGISHAVLPGLAIAFLLTNSRDILPMVVGAVIAGVLTAILTQVVQRFGQVESGAALGVVFCGLFATGLILIRVASDKVDLDADCVLYGSIETAVVDEGRVPRGRADQRWLAAGQPVAHRIVLQRTSARGLRSRPGDDAGFQCGCDSAWPDARGVGDHCARV